VLQCICIQVSSINRQSISKCPNAQTVFVDAQNEWKQVRRKEKEDLEQIINTYFATPIQPPLYTSFSSTSRARILNNQEGYKSDSEESNESSSTITVELPLFNASAQKLSLVKQKAAEKKLAKLNDLYRIAQDPQLLSSKKLKTIEENSEVIRYDSPRRPSFLQQKPDLPIQLHSYVEFGSATQKRRKEIIKVRTTLYLKTEMEERYKIYMS
ncbi:35059_t:CDS:2, partial [Gigaspora margarita]